MTQPSSSVLTCNSLTSFSQKSKNPATEFFKEICRNSGIKLSSSDDPNTISQEQALVVRDILKLIGENPSEDPFENFMKGFKLLVKKDKYMRKALLPTQLKKNLSENDITIQQESLFRIFLKVPRLQSHVMDHLLDKIIANMSEENEDDTSWLRLLLSQLRYLPHIEKPGDLTTKLLDVIEIAPFPAQLEILDSIPEILPDSEYSEVAKQLSKMLDDNEQLSGAIIDCLNALNLDSEIRGQVQDHILSQLLIRTNVKLFPIFLEFLMTDYKAQNLSATFVKIRNALDSIMASSDQTNKERESGKIVIFNRLQSLSWTLKIASETWLSVISNIKVHTDHKPVDLLILFMLHTSAKLKKRTIELAIRKKVKDGTFKCSLLEQFFERCLPAQLLRDYFASIIEVGASLLRSSGEANVIEFASTLFKLLFYHEHTQTIYRQELIDNLVLLAGSETNVTCILNIFLSLLDDITLIKHHTVLLMRLLENLDNFELRDIKLVFEILSALICNDYALSGQKDEIHMIVKKQLSSSKRSLKHRGIISGVVIAKHIATTSEDQSDVQFSENSFLNLSDLNGEAHEAAALLELVKTSTGDSPELLGLYYDQLAGMIMKSKNLDRHFFAWLHEAITSDFESIFVTHNECVDTNDLEFGKQFGLLSDDEMEMPIAVNIGELTVRSEEGMILILAPHFRLLRLLHFRHKNGDLSSINALLGCPVVLPKLEQWSSYDSDQLQLIADCLFHCINWFREIISGFVTQKSVKLRVTLVKRLDNLIKLERLLGECLDKIPSHKLPISYFDGLSQSTRSVTNSPQKGAPKRPKKKLKTREMVDDTTVASTSKKPPPPSKRVVEERRVSFREMDTDLLRLLKYPLTFDDLTPCSERICLNVDQLNFILKDFVTKLTLLTKGCDLGLSHLNLVEPLDFMSDCIQILPNINKHFSQIVDKIKEAEDDDDSIVSSEIQTSFGLVFETLALIFNWSGFQHSKNFDLLKDILIAFGAEDSSQFISVARLVRELVTRLAEHHQHCFQLSQAVHLIKVLEALHALSPSQEVRSKIAKTSGKLLNKRWNNSASIAKDIDVLIKAYLSSASVKTLCGLVGTLQDQAGDLQAKGDTLEMLPSVDKTNFYILYRNLWACLHERIKTEIQSLTNNQHLFLWKTVALTMQGLMTVVKMQETKSNQVCFMKQSIGILKVFISHGIPILEIMLKSKPDQVIEIFKTIQSSTRFLHQLCCHSKQIKSPTLIAYVPQFRLTLETLVYRVKAALVANDCSAAFWLGNLKNRDLQGEDILTQSTENTTVEENEDEEMPTDDDDDEDEEVCKSDSDVFG